MPEDYVAIYEKGDNHPVGAIRADYAEEVLEAFGSNKYITKPISKEEFGKIKNHVTAGFIIPPDRLEELL